MHTCALAGKKSLTNGTRLENSFASDPYEKVDERLMPPAPIKPFRENTWTMMSVSSGCGQKGVAVYCCVPRRRAKPCFLL